MSKVIKLASAIGLGVGALLAELAIHGFLDVMYKETIPPTIIKYLTNKKGTTGMDTFGEYTEESCKWIAQQNVEIIDRINDRGNILKGYLLESDAQSNKFVMFAHGYRSNHLGDPANFEKFYHELGFNFFSVDHTSAGDSEGNWVGFDYYESIDMLSWIDYLVDRFGENIEIILHGVSMGGATVCQMASSVPKQVKCIISDCAYTSANDEFIKVANDAGIKKLAPYALGAINTLTKRFAGYDLSQTDVRNSVSNSKVPMLFVHGLIDDFVPVEMGYELYEICGNEKDIFIVDKAYHAQSIMVDNEGYKQKIIDFTSNYI